MLCFRRVQPLTNDPHAHARKKKKKLSNQMCTWLLQQMANRWPSETKLCDEAPRYKNLLHIDNTTAELISRERTAQTEAVKLQVPVPSSNTDAQAYFLKRLRGPKCRHTWEEAH